MKLVSRYKYSELAASMGELIWVVSNSTDVPSTLCSDTYISLGTIVEKIQYPEMVGWYGGISGGERFGDPVDIGTDYTIRASVTQGDRCFIGGRGGAMLSSTDGITWDTITSGTTTDIYALDYGNGLYVRGGHMGSLGTSTDGLTWVSRSLGTTSLILGITHGMGLTVVLFQTGSVAVSADGVSWNIVAMPANTTHAGIAYGNGKFVVACDNTYYAYYSEDGYTWYATPTTLYTIPNAFVFNPVEGVFVGLGLTSKVAKSVNGINWTTTTYSGGLAAVSTGRLASINGLYFFTTSVGSYFASSDAIVWSSPFSLPSAAGGVLTPLGVTPDQQHLLGFASVGTTPTLRVGRTTKYAVPTGTDTTFTTSPIAGFSSAAINRYISSIDSNQNVPIGQVIGTYTATPTYSRTHPNHIAACGSVYLQSEYPELFSHLGLIDCSSFTPVTTGTTSTLYALTYGNGGFVAAGHLGVVRTSTDGITWTAATFGSTSTAWAMTYGNGLFVAAGHLGVIRTSTDGITWAAATSGTTSTLRAITYGNGLFVAAGHLGVIRTSTDGITWAAATSGTTSTLYALTYGNGGFVAGGHLGVVRTSTDGITWAAATSGTTSTITGLAYGNNIYVGVSWFKEGSVTSTDGLTWSSFDTGVFTSTIWNTVAYGNGLFVRGGTEGSVQTSTNGSTWTKTFSGTNLEITALLYGGTAWSRVGFSGSAGVSADPTVLSYAASYNPQTEFLVPNVVSRIDPTDANINQIVYISAKNEY